MLRYSHGPYEPSGLTDPQLHIFTPDGTDVATTDGAVYRLGSGDEFAITDPAARLAEVAGIWADRILAFDATLEQNHPVGAPHHYLAILAVRPDRQERGIGTSLLRSYHEELDKASDGPAYLEAAHEPMCGFYRRHGYALMADAPFYLPDDGPPMWPMARRG